MSTSNRRVRIVHHLPRPDQPHGQETGTTTKARIRCAVRTLPGLLAKGACRHRLAGLIGVGASLLAKEACRHRLAGLIGVGASLLAKEACRHRLVGSASKVREQARSYPTPADLMPFSEELILQFSKLTGGKSKSWVNTT